MRSPLKDPEFRLLERLVAAIERVAKALEDKSRVAKIEVLRDTTIPNVDGQLFQETDNKVG